MKRALTFSLAGPGRRAPAARPDQTDTGQGSVAAPFLTLPSDARSAAMAQAGVASTRDINAMSLNPAGLAGLAGQQVGLNQNFWLQGSSVESLSYGTGLFRHAGLGLDLNYFSVGAVDRVAFDASGQLQNAGSFNPYYLSGGIGYGEEFGHSLSLGVLGKMVQQNIDGSTASAFAADLGLEYSTPLKGLTLGLSEQNLGGTLAGSSLPLMTRVGASFAMGNPDRNSLLVNVDGQIPAAALDQTSLSAGVELHTGRFLSLRGGYELQQSNGLTGLSGFTAGAGLGRGGLHYAWELDYAWVPMGDLGHANQISLLTKF